MTSASPSGSADEYVLDTPTVRSFIADVRAAIAQSASPEAACDAIRPRFAALLADPEWLEPGDFYALLPPRDDIHRVRTTSPETSVSIHLLTNDTGCVWRHAYEPESGAVRPFRSGWVNVACAEDPPERPRR